MFYSIFFYIGGYMDENNLALLSVQEDERRRIAMELHDTALQNLAYIIRKIELSGKYIDIDPEKAKSELTLVNNSIRSVIEEIRNTIYDLRPMVFDDLGFKAACDRLVQKMYENNHYYIVSDIDDIEGASPIILTTIYRIIQESLQNIMKHSEATKVKILCNYFHNTLHLYIEDDGVGFDTDKVLKLDSNHFGLKVIKERVELLGGNINIMSEKGKGTRIDVIIEIN